MLLHTSLWHSLVHIYNIAAIVNPFVMDIKHEPLLIFCIYCICQCVLQCYAKLRLPFILIALLCTGTWIRAAVHKWCICKGTVSPTWFQINIISLSARLIFFSEFSNKHILPLCKVGYLLRGRMLTCLQTSLCHTAYLCHISFFSVKQKAQVLKYNTGGPWVTNMIGSVGLFLTWICL